MVCSLKKTAFYQEANRECFLICTWMILRFVIRSAHLAKNIKSESEDVRSYGYEKVLEPLLRDLVTLESHGIFISFIFIITA